MNFRKPSIETILCKALPASAIVAASAFAPSSAQATTPAAAFDYATIVGSGNTIHVDRVPVIGSSGNVIYEDVQLTFRLTTDSTGNPTLSNPSTTVTASPSLTTAQFQPGTYFALFSSTVVMATLTYGPNASGGSTVWALSLKTQPGGIPAPAQSSWQTGAPAMNLQARIVKAKITLDPNYSYGLNGQPATYGSAFPRNGLLAAQQTGTQLTLFSFSYTTPGVSGVIDTVTPTGSVVFTMCADAACSNAPK
jgi:hypothetical protein